RAPTSALVTEDDLIAAGELALWQSIDRYRLGMGTQFATFAGTRIRGAMIDWIRSADWIGRRGRKAEKNGEEMPDMCSLAMLPGIEQAIKDDDEPNDSQEDALRAITRRLDRLQRKVLLLLYVERLKPDQAAKLLGIASSRVREIAEQIARRLQV